MAAVCAPALAVCAIVLLGFAFCTPALPSRASDLSSWALTQAWADESNESDESDEPVSAEEYGSEEDPDSAETPAPDSTELDADEETSDSTEASASASESSSSSVASSDSEETFDEEIPDYSSMSLEKLQEEVAAKTTERDAAQAQSDELAARIAETDKALSKALRKTEKAQRVAERAVRERYKVQRQYPTLFDALLDADDFSSFLAGIEYIEAASKVSVTELTELRNETRKYETKKQQLEKEKARVDKNLAFLSAALKAAIEARDEAQRKADLVANAHLNPDEADWDGKQEDFIAEWGPRLDAYLAGSPLEGQGATFAKAAWKNHIDPRWSAAISNQESGKGQICIRPYNAWGWGAAEPDPYGLALEWASWEEAINAHAQGLAIGYGYTISPEGAQRYCPPGWEEWYANTVNEMNSI
jgi:hypothetical protein